MKEKRECGNCGEDFVPQRNTQKFCSRACAAADQMLQAIKQSIRHQHELEEAYE